MSVHTIAKRQQLSSILGLTLKT